MRASDQQPRLGEPRVQGLGSALIPACPWILRRLVLAKPPVEVPKEGRHLDLACELMSFWLLPTTLDNPLKRR
jgi:hypothetical protein